MGSEKKEWEVEGVTGRDRHGGEGKKRRRKIWEGTDMGGEGDGMGMEGDGNEWRRRI